jgi:hypothetical protein
VRCGALVRGITAPEAAMPGQPFLTPKQSIALSLAFKAVGERRHHRSDAEYASIAAKFPPPKEHLEMVNALLRSMHQRSMETGDPLPRICRCRTDDEIRGLEDDPGARFEFEDYPGQISRETLRKALTFSRMRVPRRRG